MLKFPKYKYVLLLADISTAILSLFISSILTKEVDLKFFISLKFTFLIFFQFFLVFIFKLNDLYKVNIFSTRISQFVRLLRSLSIYLPLYVLFGLLLNLKLIFAYVLILLIMFTFYRVILLPSFLKYFMNLKFMKRKCVIVGAGELGLKILNNIVDRTDLGLEIFGFIDDNILPKTRVYNGYNILGNTNSIIKVCRENNIDEIIIGVNDITYEHLIEIVNKAHKTNCTIRVVSSIFKTASNKFEVESYGNLHLVTLSSGIYSKIFLIQKRIFDLTLSFIILVFLLPLFALIAVLIKVTSKGPVFYKQERIGKDGKKFKMYKFRTMYVGSDKDSLRAKLMKEFIERGEHPEKNAKSTKIVDKSKVTSIGKILRKFSLDELPQLINVLRGEMSLVGPRPVLPYEYEMFKPWYHERDKVLPGCTGFWQVYGRSKTNFDEMVLMDIYYIQNMSPWLDLWIILKTIPVMILGKSGE